ncbi:MAG: hypothetical protein ACQES9_09990 [Myxococcota bacterium]
MKNLVIIIIFLFSGFSCKETQTEEKPEEQAQSTEKKKVESVEKEKPKKELAKVESSIKIPVCEKYIQFVCKCARKYPDKKFVNEACKMARKTYPSWKEMAKEPEQQQAIMRSCKKAINELKVSDQCE